MLSCILFQVAKHGYAVAADVAFFLDESANLNSQKDIIIYLSNYFQLHKDLTRMAIASTQNEGKVLLAYESSTNSEEFKELLQGISFASGVIDVGIALKFVYDSLFGVPESRRDNIPRLVSVFILPWYQVCVFVLISVIHFARNHGLTCRKPIK